MPQPPKPATISVVIIANNDATSIERCVRGAKLLTDDVVVVVDSASVDGTAQKARDQGAQVLLRDWDGYGGQKNFGNAQVNGEFIFSLDADEEITSLLARDVQAMLRRPEADVFRVRILSYFGDTIVRYGDWNPCIAPRIFRRASAQWNMLPVHENLEFVPGTRIASLTNSPLYHHTAPTREYYRAKMDRYARLFAEKLRSSGRKPSLLRPPVSASWRFFRAYVLRLGVLDGVAGMQIAYEEARYTYLKYRLAVRGG